MNEHIQTLLPINCSLPDPCEGDAHVQPSQKSTLIREIDLGFDLNRHLSRETRGFDAAVRMIASSPEDRGKLKHSSWVTRHYGMFTKQEYVSSNFNFNFETRRKVYQVYLCHCKEVGLISREGPKQCFEGFVSSRNCLILDRFKTWC